MTKAGMTLIAFVVLPFFAIPCWSTTILDYMESQIPAGEIIYETPEVDAQRYLLLNYDRTFESNSVISQLMKAGRQSAGQGEFTKIRIHQLLSSVSEDSVAEAQSINIYLKVAWTGKKEEDPSGRVVSMLQPDLEGQTVVKGHLNLNTKDNSFRFTLDAIPNLYFIGLFNPDTTLATMFARKLPDEKLALERDVTEWAREIISAVIPSYFDGLRDTKISQP